MADDIDIEEHDVMDNPVIRNIFPDLSILKKEVLDEYDETSTIEQTLNEEEENLNCNSVNDINFFSVPKVNGESSDGDIMLRFKKKRKITNDKIPVVDESNTVALHKNKIILGSKPSSKFIQKNVEYKSDPKINTATVTLKNLRPFLDNCNKYCEICFILFPNSKALNNHKKCLHCSLSSEKKPIDIPKIDLEKTQNVGVNKPKCNICHKTFASRSSLNKHKRNIHFIRVKIRRVNKTKNVAVKIASGYNKEKISLTSNNSCFHCNRLFPNMQSLIEHLYDTLETKQDKKHSKTKNNLGMRKSHVKDIFSNSKHLHQKFEAEKVRRKKSSSNNFNSYVYRCPLCSYYFNNVKFSSTHLLKKHKFTKKTPLKKVLYDPKCKFCSSEFGSVASYNGHLHKVHKNLLSRVFKTKSSNKPSKASGLNEINAMKNNISLTKDDPILQEIPNVSQTSITITKESALGGILKSALFRCNRCDIHFLQSQIAVDHSSHMEFLVNWKCSLCNRIFKKNDELSHRQQHLVTNNFTVYGLCESTQSLILYKCLKCTVHFDENMFIQHFPICETVAPNHIQCKFCDILIDCNLKSVHENEHRSKAINYKDFTIVRTEVIQSNIIDENRYNKKKRELKSRVTVDSNSYESHIKKNNLDCLFTVYYCNTCKCFVNDSTKLVIHKKSHCTHVVPATCKLCGLIITQTSVSSHGRLHQRKKNLTLQDFKFYDLKSRKRIAPPIPEFPHCGICGIYFANQIAKIRHECGVDDYVTCSDCEMNFSELGYKLHMNYHNYRLQYHNINSEHLLQSKSGSKTKAKNIDEIKSNLTPKMPGSDLEESERFIIYSCKNCHICVDAYDLVVEHCQRHYNPLRIQSSTKICKLCDLIFDVGCYEDHEKLHLCNFNKKDFKIIKFDIFYFTTDYDAWIKRVFDSLPQEQMQKIINKSIYKYENKIKMKVIQEASPEFTVYKCDKCHCFIDQYSLYKHLGNNCLSLRKHTCRICGIPFISATSKVQHEAIHKRPFKGLKSYRIVLFNRDEDKMFNDSLRSGNWFTLYTCRNCEGVVGKTEYKHHICNKNDLKKCSYCGLLLYSKEYNVHISKHKEFESFNSKNIKVILIGKKIENEDCKNLKDDNLVSSFNGKVYDYILYKCTKCQICTRNARDTLKHDCSFEIPKSKCSYCGFYFEARKLKHHYILHETDCNFITENITINDFDNTKSQKRNFDLAKTSKLNKTDIDEITDESSKPVKFLPSTPSNLHIKKNFKDSSIKEKTAKLYKCSCGLHFLDNSVTAHLNVCGAKNRISRQQCSKCGLTFSPNVLFTHMLAHHGNKAVVYKFDIIEVLKDEDTP